MATTQIFPSFKKALAEKKHDLSTDVLKVALTNTQPALSNTQLSDIAQISGAGGYAAGTLAGVTSSETGGVYALAFGTPLTFTAAGAAYDAFRYLVIYNDTATNKELIGYLDYGVSYVLPDGQPFTLNSGQVFTLA